MRISDWSSDVCSSDLARADVIEQGSRRRAFEEVVAEQLDALYRTALRYTRGNPACAEDLLQDTLLAALAAWPQLREPQRARVWLFRLLSRTPLNRSRHAARQRRKRGWGGKGGEVWVRLGG